MLYLVIQKYLLLNHFVPMNDVENIWEYDIGLLLYNEHVCKRYEKFCINAMDR